MDGDVEVPLLDFLCHDVRDDLLDGQCSQPVLDEAVVLELAGEVVAVLFVLLHADDGVVLPELLDADDLPVLLAVLDVAGVPVLLELLDADDLLILLELPYDDVADAQFESLDALDEPVEGLDVGCQCQPLRSRCPTLLADVETILLHSHVRLDDMDVLFHIPNHDDDDDDVDAGPNDILNISNVDPDLDVANVLVDANVVMVDGDVAHRCRLRSRR